MQTRPHAPTSAALRSRRWHPTIAAAALLALGCDSGANSAATDDSVMQELHRRRHDLASPQDLAQPRDLAPPRDLAQPSDLAQARDLAQPPDMAKPADLSKPPDLTPPPDLASGGGPTIAGCAVFPADNPWNRDVSADPVDPNSATYIAAMNGASSKLHPDFGSDPSYGIPWITVPGNQAMVPMSFAYADESDPGPYPIPANAPIEGGANSGGDQHVIVLDRDHCKLYETYNSNYVNPGWSCDSGARFDLNSNSLRPDYWTSADAAGLPILPGLVRLSEVQAGAIHHALRFTVAKTQKSFVHPATHYASNDASASLPPMGVRVRLKASFDTSGYVGAAKVILTAMKRYGMFLADNGSNWYFTGETNPAWNDADLSALKNVPASAFEVVKLGPIIK